MEEIDFEVQGSAEEPYRVVFMRESPQGLSAYCTCPAGNSGQYCKHRIAILDGIQENIVSPNSRDVSVIASWARGTEIEKCLLAMRKLEDEAGRLKAALATAKKDLSKAMRGTAF